MTIREDLKDLNEFIDNVTERIELDINSIQKDAYQLVRDAVLSFELENNRIVIGSDFYSNLVKVENRLKELFKTNKYKGSVSSYLDDLNVIFDRSVDLHRTYNDLKEDIKALSQAKQTIYNEAKANFSQGAIAKDYIQPVKNLLARSALGGQTFKQTMSLIDKWDKGELSSGRLNRSQQAPSLNRYAVQMAKDTAFSMQRTSNEIIKDKLGLQKFIYVGGLVKDSRPLCRHLVGLRRKIDLDEIPKLVAQYPDGLYPNTTKDNFLQVCGGYGCNHTAMAVR